MSLILKSGQACRDLIEVADYLAQSAGLAKAERFLDAVELELSDLAIMPLMGSPWESSHSGLSGIRSWAVPKFRKYLVFYRPLESGIELLRVLQGARDADALLSGTED